MPFEKITYLVFMSAIFPVFLYCRSVCVFQIWAKVCFLFNLLLCVYHLALSSLSGKLEYRSYGS